MTGTTTPVLDARQLSRIEGVHRGFLYQHLYAAACLFSAQSVNATAIVVEKDEDLEIVFSDRRIYLQVKTRSASLKFSDIESNLQRFDSLRIEHVEGRRQGFASFFVVANVAPGPELFARLQSDEWPVDVKIHWPGSAENVNQLTPSPWPDINAAFRYCTELAASLPYARLSPETLVWKLAGCVMAAAAGNPPRVDHTFQTEELPNLFEQVVLQLQDFPAPPIVYRAHADEPPLESAERVRIVTGYSGSGKTSWVSQAALHAKGLFVYFDVTDTPGTALTSAIAREIAARLFGRTGGQLGEILLPGATGAEILRTIGTKMAESGQEATVVLDNAHLITPADIQMLVKMGGKLKFLLLCHPGRHIQEMEARLSITAEPLRGWENDTIALEVESQKCRADYVACQRLASLTAGMPLYVQNAIAITAAEYDGSISSFCTDLEQKTHTRETAQEFILAHVFGALPAPTRDAIGVLSISDIPLERTDAKKLIENRLGIEDKEVAVLLRELRSTGCMDVFGNDRIKIHDSMRLIGQTHLERLGGMQNAKAALKDILAISLQQHWEISKLLLYFRMLVAVGDIKTLIQLSTDELFHELGVQSEIIAFLDEAAVSKKTQPEDRFWALDGLVFSDFKHGNYEKAIERQDIMERLIVEHNFGDEEILTLSMKRMNMHAVKGDVDAVLASIDEISELMPDTNIHQRIFRYNAALALFSLGQYEHSATETLTLIQEYYDILGIELEDVIGQNPDKIWPLLKKGPDFADNLKHLADCIDLNSKVVNALGRSSPFGRIHAMKFYQMANAPDSFLRLGQELVDEFIERNDFINARQIIETHLLPGVYRLKMLGRVIQIRSQYAVVLAYCGDFDAAEAEMNRLAPYEAGLDVKGQWELRNQRELIAELRQKGPPPQWMPPSPAPAAIPRRKIGRNEPCPCGSGKKYKKCHGFNP